MSPSPPPRRKPAARSAASTFYQGGTTLLGTVTTSPYSYTWTTPANGSYALTAVATTGDSQQVTSTAVNITVGASGPPSGMALWLKADAGVTTSSSNVTQWADQSGNGNNVTPDSTATARR